MVAGHAEHLVARLAQRFEESARLLELLGPGALGEIAADDDEVGPMHLQPGFGRRHDLLVVSAEMEVGELDDGRNVR